MVKEGRTMAQAIKDGNYYSLNGAHGYNYAPPAAETPEEVLAFARAAWMKCKPAHRLAMAGVYSIERITGGRIGARSVELVDYWTWDGREWLEGAR